MPFTKKIKRALFFMACFFKVACLFAQNDITDNLNKKLQNVNNRKEIINVRNLIAAELRLSNPDSAISFAQATINQSEKEHYE